MEVFRLTIDVYITEATATDTIEPHCGNPVTEI